MKLKGLTTGSSAESSTEEFRDKARAEENIEKSKHKKLRTNSNIAKPSSAFNLNAKTESTSVALVSVEADQLDEQIKSLMTKTEKMMTSGNTNKAVFACNQCGKEGQWQNIRTHIEANHIANNISHSCDICGKVSRSKDGLRKHKTKEHC